MKSGIGASEPAVIILIALAVMLTGCDMLGFKTWTWHQKITISVDTPDGVKTGSSVIELSYGWTPRWWGLGDAAGMSTGSMSGDATFVDLGRGRYLVAPLRDGEEANAEVVFLPQNPFATRDERALLYDEMISRRETKPLPRRLYPLLVAFDDINSPASVREVGPDDLGATYGEGYRLRSITIEITDEPLTRGKITKLFPWLCELKKSKVSLSGETGPVSDNRVSNKLSASNFSDQACGYFQSWLQPFRG